MNRRRRNKMPVFAVIFMAAAALALVFLANFFSKNIVFEPGVVTYDESLTAAEKSFLEKVFIDKTLKNDVTISANSSTSYAEMGSDGAMLLYDLYLPVSGFYNSKIGIESAEALSLEVVTLDGFDDEAKNDSSLKTASAVIAPSDENMYLMSIRDLDDTVRALEIDDHYYLEELVQKKTVLSEMTGAVFRSLKFNSNDPNEARALVEAELASFPTAESILTVNQTGVTALTRQMQTKLNAVGDASYFAEKIADFLKSTDLTHTSNEVSFAKDCTSVTGMAFCADLRMLDVLTDSGINIVELTGNHNNDWGAQANQETVELYRENGIEIFGGGVNEEEAKKPLEIDQKGSKITWIGVSESTSTKANGQGASGNHPGSNIYDEATTRTQITEAKARGDFVIVDVQYYECYSYPEYGEEMPACDAPISGQETFFKGLIDMGADMVVGTQAHQPQSYELYHGKAIYYGLGNLFFDQTYWPGTERSLVLTHYFYNGKLLQTRITPTMYDKSYQTAVMGTSAAEAYLNRLTAPYRNS